MMTNNNTNNTEETVFTPAEHAQYLHEHGTVLNQSLFIEYATEHRSDLIDIDGHVSNVVEIISMAARAVMRGDRLLRDPYSMYGQAGFRLVEYSEEERSSFAMREYRKAIGYLLTLNRECHRKTGEYFLPRFDRNSFEIVDGILDDFMNTRSEINERAKTLPLTA